MIEEFPKYRLTTKEGWGALAGGVSGMVVMIPVSNNYYDPILSASNTVDKLQGQINTLIQLPQGNAEVNKFLDKQVAIRQRKIDTLQAQYPQPGTAKAVELFFGPAAIGTTIGFAFVAGTRYLRHIRRRHRMERQMQQELSNELETWNLNSQL